MPPTIIMAAVNIAHGVGMIDGLWGRILNSGGIANTHSVFKLSTAILLLPLAKPFEKMSRKLVKDDPNKVERGAEIEALDEALYSSPALALNSTYRALCAMNDMINANVFTAIRLAEKYDAAAAERIKDDEQYMDQLEDAVNAYLAKMTPHLKPDLQDSIQNYYLQCVTDFERSGDHVYSICESAEAIYERAENCRPKP